MLKIEIWGLEEAVSRLDRISQETRDELKDAMDMSLRDIQEEARQHHRYTTRTGTAERSIDTEASYRSDNFSGTVGTTRKITVFLHQGTKAHVITPKRKLALRWTNGGSFVFAKRAWHPGTHKDPFIYNALWKKRSGILSRFGRAVRHAIGEGVR